MTKKPEDFDSYRDLPAGTILRDSGNPKIKLSEEGEAGGLANTRDDGLRLYSDLCNNSLTKPDPNKYTFSFIAPEFFK